MADLQRNGDCRVVTINQQHTWTNEMAIADPKMLRGRQPRLSFLFTTWYRAVHSSIEHCTSLASSVRYFWGT